MAILFIADGVNKPKLNYKRIIFWLRQIILSYDCILGDMTYILCNDKYLLDINYRFLKHDYFTDIVTFDYCKDKTISGDFFISIERVKENSILYNVAFEEELLRVIVHGLLHLLGFMDKSKEEKKLMRDLEDSCILMFQKI